MDSLWAYNLGIGDSFEQDSLQGHSGLSGSSVGFNNPEFFISVVALTVAKALRYQAISESVGTTISPSNPLDMGGAFVFAWIFFTLLNRREGKASDE
ncbi:MAG: hypothetical protein MN733_26535 [Nitrososphaera sp.]|nr:hypothetical protein [Nitrososphaera sp.]